MSDEELLVDRDEYLSSGVHIGTKQQHKHMEKYIFHVKKNQLAVLDVSQTDERISRTAELLTKYEPEDVLLVARKEEAWKPVNVLADETGFNSITGRFMPGTLTNPSSDSFIEPEIIFVMDPEENEQAIDEAVDAKIPVVSLTDSEDSLSDIDIAIPANTKAEGSLSLVCYLIGMVYSDLRGEEFNHELEDFRSETEEE